MFPPNRTEGVMWLWKVMNQELRRPGLVIKCESLPNLQRKPVM